MLDINYELCFPANLNCWFEGIGYSLQTAIHRSLDPLHLLPIRHRQALGGLAHDISST